MLVVLGGHVVLTAGEVEIRDETEGGGHLESRRSQFFRKHMSAFKTYIKALFKNTDFDLSLCKCAFYCL